MQLAIEIEWPWRRGWQLKQGMALVHQEIFKGIESNSSIGGNVSTVCSNEEVKLGILSALDNQRIVSDGTFIQ